MNQDNEDEIKKEKESEQKIAWKKEADISQSLYIGY